jgi:hypothetical protein
MHKQSHGDTPILEIAKTYEYEFTSEFMRFLEANTHIYDAFEREALHIIARGFKHYSARTIIHVLRHHSALSQEGEWKINNNVSPYLARLFAYAHPQHADLFEYRIAKAVHRPIACQAPAGLAY